MSVRYVPIDGERVSEEWHSVLRDMRAAGVQFNVNEGHRTMARQQYFWDLYRSGRGNLAAYPSATAPHIRTGRIDHAIDFSNDGAVFSWLTGAGLRPVRTVQGESWHIEITGARLAHYHATQGDPVIRKGCTNIIAVRRLQRLLKSLHYTHVVNGTYGLWTRRAVRKFQKRHALPVDGVVGPRTWAAIRRATNKD